MKETPGSSETSVLTRATRRNNPADTILHVIWMFWFCGRPTMASSTRNYMTASPLGTLTPVHRVMSQNSRPYIVSVRFEVFMAATMKNIVFWDMMPCGSHKNRCFGGTYRHHHQGDRNRSLLLLLVTVNVVPSSPIRVILMMRRYVHPKRRFLQEPYGVTSQKTQFFSHSRKKSNVTWKNVICWDVTPCGSCKNRSLQGMYRLHRQCDNNQRVRNNVSSN
jgi:hypothetical protein